MTKECNYCGATEEYIENGEVCECGVELISVNSNEGYYWGGDLMFNNIDNILEDKRSGRFVY